MKNDRRILASILYVFLGAVLLILGIAEVTDAFWSGMGSALIVIGILRIIQFFRYRKDNCWLHRCGACKPSQRSGTSCGS